VAVSHHDAIEASGLVDDRLELRIGELLVDRVVELT